MLSCSARVDAVEASIESLEAAGERILVRVVRSGIGCTSLSGGSWLLWCFCSGQSFSPASGSEAGSGTAAGSVDDVNGGDRVRSRKFCSVLTRLRQVSDCTWSSRPSAGSIKRFGRVELGSASRLRFWIRSLALSWMCWKADSSSSTSSSNHSGLRKKMMSTPSSSGKRLRTQLSRPA